MNMDSTLSAVVTEYNSTCNSLSLTEEKRVKLKLCYKLDNVSVTHSFNDSCAVLSRWDITAFRYGLQT